MSKKICFFNIFPAHYRKAIFNEMAINLDIDFYFGDKMIHPPQKVDEKSIPGFRGILRNSIIHWPLYWQWGVISLLFKPYVAYITMGNIWCVSTWFFLILGRFFTKKKFFLWSHGWYGNETVLRGSIKKLFYSLAHDVFVYGEYSKTLMLKNGFRADHVHVIYNSLDYDLQIQQRSQLSKTSIYPNHFKNNYPNLVFIGRLTPRKQLNLIIEALYFLKEHDYNVNMTFVGDGEAQRVLEEMVLAKNLYDYVWFYGSCYDEDTISELIYNADLCISPGKVGLTAIHSMVYGTPVLTHNSLSNQGPEFEAIVDGCSGCFFEFGNSMSMVNQIKMWLEYTSSHREIIRQCCYRIIDEKYNPHVQVAIMKNVLSKNNCL